MGLVAYYVADQRQRKAFLDTRQSSEMRLTIENQAREQVMTYRFKDFCIKVYINVDTYLLGIFASAGTIVAVSVTSTRGCKNATGFGNESRRPIQKDLHESTRKRQVSKQLRFFRGGMSAM